MTYVKCHCLIAVFRLNKKGENMAHQVRDTRALSFIQHLPQKDKPAAENIFKKYNASAQNIIVTMATLPSLHGRISLRQLRQAEKNYHIFVNNLRHSCSIL
jgi:hypothetical protein